jgi:hypothetical protein
MRKKPAARAEIFGADVGNGEAVRDAGERPGKPRGAFRHRRDLQGELGEEAQVRAVSGHRDDLVEVAAAARGERDAKARAVLDHRFDGGTALDPQKEGIR